MKHKFNSGGIIQNTRNANEIISKSEGVIPSSQDNVIKILPKPTEERQLSLSEIKSNQL